MNKQELIDALSAENVRMSALLQKMANMLPAMANILGESDYITAEFTIQRWLDEMAEMDITPREKVQS